MSTQPNDGGPAFPRANTVDEFGVPLSTTGMSLRDWFAGQALAGYCASPDFDPTRKPGESLNEATARICYAKADVMLAERSKTTKSP